MRVLVTGGAGYIGTALVARLIAKQHRVTVLDNLTHGGTGLLHFFNHPYFTFTRGDIRLGEVVRAALVEQDAVVHLAGLVGDPACNRFPGITRAVNVTATRYLLQAAQEVGVGRFLFASTNSIYGVTAPGDYADEDTPVNPLSLYAESKAEAEIAVLEANGPDFTTLVMRFPTVFGIGNSGRPRFDLILNEFVHDALIQGCLRVYGEQAWRSHVHVSDLATSIDALLSMPYGRIGGQVVNVPGHNRRKVDLVEAIREHAPDFQYHTVEGGPDPRDYKVSFRRGMDWGLSAPISPEMGVAEVVGILRSGLLGNIDKRYRNA